MDLPSLLPKELNYASVAESHRNLLNLLIKVPQDFITFFEYACDDETWSEVHAGFMKEAIGWMTQQFLQDKFLADLASRAVHKIREHSSVLHSCVPKNLAVSTNGSKKKINSLLWGASSEYLRNLIRQECRDKNTNTLELEDVSGKVFDQIEEFINTGVIQELWNKEQHEVLDVLGKAAEWGLSDLTELCQDQIKKYVTHSNVIEMLLQAHEENWQNLKRYCIDTVNELDAGVRFAKSPPGVLAMEFLNFRKDAMDIFEASRFSITHLICDHNLTDQGEFSDVIQRCPNMVCLDISRSRLFSDRLLDIPDTLEELDLSQCEWLNHKQLGKIIDICPNLLKIRLASNTQLNYSSWSLLKDLKRLESIDISRCRQIRDQDFKLILQACRQVTNLCVKECSGLSDSAFFELGKQISRLTDLDVSKTKITDRGLIDVAMHCKHLISLSASQCPHVTAKGVLEVVQNASNLKQLDIAKSDINPAILKEIKEIRPFLAITFE